MNTQQVANRLVEMCRNGENMQALEELYGDNIVSREMPGIPGEVTTGIKAVFKKSEDWFENLEEMHSASVSDPLVAGNHFSVTMNMDITTKDRGRMQLDEVCVYEVNNGKIVNEQYFYSM